MIEVGKRSKKLLVILAALASCQAFGSDVFLGSGSADGATLGRVYGDVMLSGSASITNAGAMEVFGDFILRDVASASITGGMLFVHGNLVLKDAASLHILIGSISVGGDVIFSSTSQLTVAGNTEFASSGSFFFSTSGGVVNVDGKMRAQTVEINSPTSFTISSTGGELYVQELRVVAQSFTLQMSSSAKFVIGGMLGVNVQDHFRMEVSDGSSVKAESFSVVTESAAGASDDLEIFIQNSGRLEVAGSFSAVARITVFSVTDSATVALGNFILRSNGQGTGSESGLDLSLDFGTFEVSGTIDAIYPNGEVSVAVGCTTGTAGMTASRTNVVAAKITVGGSTLLPLAVRLWLGEVTLASPSEAVSNPEEAEVEISLEGGVDFRADSLKLYSVGGNVSLESSQANNVAPSVTVAGEVMLGGAGDVSGSVTLNYSVGLTGGTMARFGSLAFLLPNEADNVSTVLRVEDSVLELDGALTLGAGKDAAYNFLFEITAPSVVSTVRLQKIDITNVDFVLHLNGNGASLEFSDLTYATEANGQATLIVEDGARLTGKSIVGLCRSEFYSVVSPTGAFALRADSGAEVAVGEPLERHSGSAVVSLFGFIEVAVQAADNARLAINGPMDITMPDIRGVPGSVQITAQTDSELRLNGLRVVSEGSPDVSLLFDTAGATCSLVGELDLSGVADATLAIGAGITSATVAEGRTPRSRLTIRGRSPTTTVIALGSPFIAGLDFTVEDVTLALARKTAATSGTLSVEGTVILESEGNEIEIAPNATLELGLDAVLEIRNGTFFGISRVIPVAGPATLRLVNTYLRGGAQAASREMVSDGLALELAGATRVSGYLSVGDGEMKLLGTNSGYPAIPVVFRAADVEFRNGSLLTGDGSAELNVVSSDLRFAEPMMVENISRLMVTGKNRAFIPAGANLDLSSVNVEPLGTGELVAEDGTIVV